MFHNTKNGMLACGNVGKKGLEFKAVGDKHIPKANFSLAVDKDERGETIWLNCVAWRNIAICARDLNISQGDTVAVCGKLQSREYKGKTYTDLVVEIILTVIDKQGNMLTTAPPPLAATASQQEPPEGFIDDTAYDDGGYIDEDDVPF